MQLNPEPPHAHSQQPSIPNRDLEPDLCRLDEPIAAASSLHVAIGAYEAACKARPRDRVLLCNLSQIIRDLDDAVDKNG